MGAASAPRPSPGERLGEGNPDEDPAFEQINRGPHPLADVALNVVRSINAVAGWKPLKSCGAA
jgi:hypothetical protein